MYIKSLKLKNFRNYESLDIDLDKSVNIFHGDNAQGKTNVLEAIYYASTSKSHKGSKEKEIVRFGEEDSHIKMIVSKNGLDERIDIHLKKNKKKGIAINGIPIKKSSELLGIVNVIIFSPEDLNIIKNGPSERRRFIDLELCQLDKIYLYNLVSYNKILNQRNKLLKEISFSQNESLMSTIELWDIQLSKFGREIIIQRRKFIEKINQILKGIHCKLSGGKENIIIKYDPDCDENELEKALTDSRSRDLKYKFTSVGPHKDDLGFFLNDIDIRKFGSQGQQRTAALSLKLSEIELVKEMINDNPVLLLDDVLSELDVNRQNHLLNTLGDIQTLITCTGVDEFVRNRFNINKTFEVINGVIK